MEVNAYHHVIKFSRSNVLMSRPIGVSKNIKCFVCGGTVWHELPFAHDGKSVTTSGLFVNKPIAKSQCAQCGLVQRTEQPFLGNTDFYEKKYTNYYERPNIYSFIQERYRAMARWVIESAGIETPNSIVEVGCGRGWTLDALRELFPQTLLAGIEPSRENSAVARKKGYDVKVVKLTAENQFGGRIFDIVFSNHVIQHTTDPLEFMVGCAALAGETGVVVINVQNARRPTSEILFSDQNFSFLPYHLATLAKKAGLRVIGWKDAPENDALIYSQLLIATKDRGRSIALSEEEERALMPPEAEQVLDLYTKRSAYLNSWAEIDHYLCSQVRGYNQVYHFGAGMFTLHLACYCPGYWSQVTACVMDDTTGRFIDKRVYSLASLNFVTGDCVVIGVRPGIQRTIAARIEKQGVPTIVWDEFVEG